MYENIKRDVVKRFMKKIMILFKGILIGFASIAIPGLSASTVAIILCLYYQMIDAISSIFKNFKQSFTFLFFLILGYIIGDIIGANIISFIYEKYPLPIILMILGFIIGSLPKMVKDLLPHLKKISNWLIILLVSAFILSFTFLVTKGEEVELSINMPISDYIMLMVVGLITAGTLVIPGMDFAIVLLALGYYNAFIKLLSVWEVSHIVDNLIILGVYLISYCIGVFILSKLIKSLFKKYEIKMKFASLAFVAVSPIVIIKQCIIENDYFLNNNFQISQFIIGIILFLVAMGIILLIYHLTDPNDTRIRAMKKRHMFRFFYTIVSRLPITLYYLFKMKKIIKKNLLTFDERYELCMKIVRKINKAGNIHVKTYGQEYLSNEATLYIVNHQGRYDGVCVLTALMDYPCTIIADKSRIIHHYYIEMFQMLNGEFIDKTDMRTQVKIMLNVAERIKNGRSFIAFIEGKYGDNGNQLQEFYTGVLHPAYHSKCKITPIVLYDSYKVYSISSLKRIEPEAHILKPITYDEYKDMPKNELAALLKQRMQEKLNQIDERKLRESNQLYGNEKQSVN